MLSMGNPLGNPLFGEYLMTATQQNLLILDLKQLENGIYRINSLHYLSLVVLQYSQHLCGGAKTNGVSFYSTTLMLKILEYNSFKMV